jgi:hypothetical protein
VEATDKAGEGDQGTGYGRLTNHSGVAMTRHVERRRLPETATRPGESLSGATLGETLVDVPIPDAIRRIVNSDDRRLAWSFFVFFSRFEYALKRSNYLKPGTSDAQPHWDRFASDYNEAFVSNISADVRAAVDYFAASPPRKQVSARGVLEWSEPQCRHDGDRLLIWLLGAIRTVRNNLFHGGKFPLMELSEPSRDAELLGHSLRVLEACLALDSRVRECFFDSLEA